MEEKTFAQKIEHKGAAWLAQVVEDLLSDLEDRPCRRTRDILEASGDHYICTDEGWEPGEAKAAYAEDAAERGETIADVLIDEVNAPSEEPR